MHLLTLITLLAATTATIIPNRDHGPVHLKSENHPLHITNVTIPVDNSSIPDSIANYNFTPEFEFPLIQLFSEISSIPDKILLEGDEVLHRYFIAAGMRAPNADLSKLITDTDAVAASSDEEGLKPRASIWQILKCVGAIVQLLVSTAIPAAKILRIKKYIEQLGGVRRAVELLLGATTREEKLRAGGQALLALAGEILGISSVQTHCF
ncbi:hypothetical protein OQA88_10247 [Cercophora sp. LCS_1]